MTAPAPPTPTPPGAPPARPGLTYPPRKLDPLAALFSYLLPGLGQVLQGRIGKGLLFFVCLYTLFFYGLWMGRMKNVFVPEPSKVPEVSLPLVGPLGGLPKALYHRPQYLAQFWMGMAVWPALIQYVAADSPPPPEANLGNAGNNANAPDPAPLPVLKDYMQATSEAKINDLQRGIDRSWDLGWVYTVIAGVLNILVIYDALAGPVIRDDEDATDPTSAAKAKGGAA